MHALISAGLIFLVLRGVWDVAELMQKMRGRGPHPLAAVSLAALMIASALAGYGYLETRELNAQKDVFHNRLVATFALSPDDEGSRWKYGGNDRWLRNGLDGWSDETERFEKLRSDAMAESGLLLYVDEEGRLAAVRFDNADASPGYHDFLQRMTEADVRPGAEQGAGQIQGAADEKSGQSLPV